MLPALCPLCAACLLAGKGWGWKLPGHTGSTRSTGGEQQGGELQEGSSGHYPWHTSPSRGELRDAASLSELGGSRSGCAVREGEERQRPLVHAPHCAYRLPAAEPGLQLCPHIHGEEEEDGSPTDLCANAALTPTRLGRSTSTK